MTTILKPFQVAWQSLLDGHQVLLFYIYAYFSYNLTSDKKAESQAVVKQVGRDVHILSCDHPHCQSQVHPRLEDLALVIISWLL